MAHAVMKPERRRSPRTNLGALAYINFESNSGGIVVNASGEGLCFHSVAPVQRNGTIHFWFSAGGRRIEADGELVWTDETRKTGGIRFSTLSVEASQQVHRWIAQSLEPFTPARQAAVGAPPGTLVRSSASEPDQNTNAAPGSAKARKLLQRVRTLARWGEFSRGLATGILIALLVAAIFLFHAYKRQIGESLIHLGERFGATPRSQPVLPAPSPLPPQVSGSTVQGRAIVPAPKVASTLPNGKALPQPAATKPTRPEQEKPQPVAPTISPTPSSESLPAVDSAASSAPVPPGSGRAVQPDSVDRPADNAKVMEVKPTSEPIENTEETAEINSGVPLGKYFDVGRFKDELGAHSAMDDLAHVGFHAVVIPKHLLWMSSYQVLVGPYRNPDDAQAASGNLHSHGFKTHSLPRRSRDLTLVPSAKAYSLGKPPSEDFIVSWEAYGAEATVRFVKGGDTVAKAEGRWVRRPTKFDYDTIVYKPNDNGSRTLLEIRLHGMNQVVVLPVTSGNQAVIF